MTMRLTIRDSGLCLSLLLLAGCASNPSGPLSLSLNELGSEVKVDAGSLFQGLSHRRSHNITGLGAADSIGALTADPDPPLLFALPHLFSQVVLPDQLALRINPVCSEVVVQDLAGADAVSLADVLALRDQLQGQEAAAFLLFKLQAEQAVVQDIVRRLSPAAPAAAASAAPADPAAGAKDAQALVTAIEAWRSLSDEPATPAGLAAWQARDTALQSLVRAASAVLDAASAALAAAPAKPGLVVARWDYEKARSSGFDAAGVSLDNSSATHRVGYVVLGAPRTMTLFAGDDLLVRACRARGASCATNPATTPGASSVVDLRRSGMDSSIKPKRLYATTFQLLARHAAWSETGQFAQSQAYAIKVKEVVDALAKVSAGGVLNTLSALNVSFSQAQQMRASAANLGAVSGHTVQTWPFSFDGDHEFAESVAYTRSQRQGYLTISSMRSTLDHHATTDGAVLPREADECRLAWQAFMRNPNPPLPGR